MSRRSFYRLSDFATNTSGASLVEYAVALIVVTIIGAAVFGLGDSIALVIGNTAGAF